RIALVGRDEAVIEPSWERIATLFDAVVDLPADERDAILARECAGDAALRGEVESLVAAASRPRDPLRVAIGHEARAFVEPTGSLVGRRLGPYRIERELGRGGMGVVYLAVRDDDQYRTQVAIKVLAGGIDTPDAIARFRDERQILATLEHPNIVRLLDGGS